MELSMTNTTYQQFKTSYGEMKVILEFPKHAENEETIKQEIKAILISTLHERLRT